MTTEAHSSVVFLWAPSKVCLYAFREEVGTHTRTWAGKLPSCRNGEYSAKFPLIWVIS